MVKRKPHFYANNKEREPAAERNLIEPAGGLVCTLFTCKYIRCIRMFLALTTVFPVDVDRLDVNIKLPNNLLQTLDEHKAKKGRNFSIV